VRAEKELKFQEATRAICRSPDITLMKLMLLHYVEYVACIQETRSAGRALLGMEMYACNTASRWDDDINIQDVSGGIVNIVRGGNMDYSE
jgi:hypothetical protein